MTPTNVTATKFARSILALVTLLAVALGGSSFSPFDWFVR
jgi:hypothetical protein